MLPDRTPPPTPTPPPAGAVHLFAHHQLLRLLGKSKHSMAWLGEDTHSGQAVLLVIARQQLQGAAYQRWLTQARRIARLEHPGIAVAQHIGQHDDWPYIVYAQDGCATWAERGTPEGLPPPQIAHWTQQAAEALAAVHEAGMAHHDVQPWSLLVDESDRVRLMGWAVGAPVADGADDLPAQRRAAVADVLALGLVLYSALAAHPALDEADVAKAALRMPPGGNETVRLPWELPRPVPDGLRAIVNRACDRQPRQRYLSARTLAQALANWIQTHADGGGPLALLAGKLQAAGVLPAQRGGPERVARLALMEDCRTAELAEVVLEDLALTFELLRVVNTAQVHGEPVAAAGPVLMVRRAIALLGVNGVRRCALALRPWPGPMDAGAAEEMAAQLRRTQHAARLAVALAPAGYDGEVVALIALMQNLGRLVVQYHYPDEAAQIRRLIHPEDGGRGMGVDAAAMAVLGVEVDAVGDAVARHWGLSAEMLGMVRRMSTTGPVHAPDDDQGMLRLAASCANELSDAWWDAPRARVTQQLSAIAVRYARALGIAQLDIQADALRLLGEPQAAPAAPPRPTVAAP